MANLDLQIPNRILFGVDSLNKVGESVRIYGDRCIVVTEASVQDNPYLGQLKSILSRAGVNALVYDELQANSGSEVMHTLLTMAKASKPHSIIAFGGMKTLAIARTVAALAVGTMSVERFIGGEVPTQPGLPYFVIPTTCRDHFMAQPRYIMTDKYRQRPVIVQTPPGSVKGVFLDPKISISLSPKYYAVVMLDVLLAAVEAYTSSLANFYSDVLAIKAVELIAAAANDIAYNPRDIRPRVRAGEAGMLSALALGSSSHGLGGAISFAINSRYHIPKSWVATSVLPVLLDLHSTHQAPRVAAIAAALGEDVDGLAPDDAAHKASRAVRRIIAKLELPSRLRDFNISLDMVQDIADISGELEYSRMVPFSAGHQVLYDIIKQSF